MKFRDVLIALHLFKQKFSSYLANNLATTAEGKALDARQGKILDDKVEAINSNLGSLSFAKGTDGKWGYKVAGADPVIPFKSYEKIAFSVSGQRTFDIESLFPSNYNNFTSNNFIISATQSAGTSQSYQTNGNSVRIDVTKTFSGYVLTTNLSVWSAGTDTLGNSHAAALSPLYDVYVLLT